MSESVPANEPDSSASPELFLDFHGRIIEHLGLQMYQSPTAAIAELVSNGWDADAERVDIALPENLDNGAVITIKDFGNGMTLAEVQDNYLKVGLNRRRGKTTERSPGLDRVVLGRKGIGKFAGFGIARRIVVETISRNTGEKTMFELDYDRIRGTDDEYVKGPAFQIAGATYEGPDSSRIAEHGTTITLAGLSIARQPAADQMRRSLSRRFSLGASLSSFALFVNGVEVPTDGDSEGVQFSFPQDYEGDEWPPNLNRELQGDWGLETLPDGTQVRWRYRFYSDTINEPELAGIAVFASGKVAQMPFLFNLAGGLGGQHGAAYMAGRVEADFLDQLSRDIIAPERQRIDWEAPEASALLKWGQDRTKELLRIWKARRGVTRQRRLEERMAPVEAILASLRTSELRPLRKLLKQLASIESIDDAQYVTMAEALVTAWKAGRLRDLIDRLSDTDDLDETQVVQVLLEANVLTDLQMAEIVRTRIDVIKDLRQRIERRDLEGLLRDFIAEHPELISPQWSTFRRETRVTHVIRAASNISGVDTDENFRGRIDLTMSSDSKLLVLEFMRPGLTLDYDHIQRFQRYIAEIKEALVADTAMRLTEVIGYIVADNANRRGGVNQLIQEMANNKQFVMTWKTLLAMAEDQWREHMDLLRVRSDGDDRIRNLAE